MDSNNTNGNKQMEEAVDEFGRPLRPNKDSSSDSDSDREEYRYRKRRDRDYDRYSPDRYNRGGSSRGGDHSPERRRRSPSPNYNRSGRGGSGRGGSGRGDDWDNYRNSSSNRNGYSSDDINGHHGHHHRGGGGSDHTSNNTNTSNASSNNTTQQNLTSPNTPNKNITTATTNTTKRQQKKGDIFEGGYFRSYKQFLDYQDEHIAPAEADKKYEEYKVEYSRRQSRVFFKEHQNEEWFKEKYEPIYLSKKRKEKVEKSKSLIQTFSMNLNDENHKFSLESKDNIKEGDKLDLDGLDMHHHDTENNSSNNNNNNNNNNGTEEDKDKEQDEKMEEDDKNEKSTTSTTPTTSLTKTSITAASNINDKDKSTLFIKSVSPSCTKDELLEVLNKVAPPGEGSVVTKLTLSEPVRYKHFYRLGWVTYKNCELASKALKELNGYKMKDFDLYLNINKPSEDAERRFKITPHIASTENRINIDLEQSTTLMKLFDQNKGITNNPIESFEKWNQLSNIEKLDRTILYLRYVHFYCYYCSEEFSDECETIRKCGTIHLRRSPGETTSISIPEKKDNDLNNNNNNTAATTTASTTGNSENDENMNTEEIKKNNNSDDENKEDKEENDDDDKDKEDKDSMDDSKDNESTTATTNNSTTSTTAVKPKLTSESESLWVTSLDNNTKNKIQRIPTSDEQFLCKEAIEKAAEEYIATNTIKIEEEKFKCNLCSKLFKGAEYVKKHINLKHPEELKNESEQKGTEEQFFLNYFSDPRRITPLPPQQQQQPQNAIYGFGPGGQPVVGARGMVGGPGGAPRGARFNPAIGQWEPIFQPIGIMPPGMIQQPQMVQLMSPVFASPNGIRGRGGQPPHGIVPMRRSFGGSSNTGSGSNGNLSPNPRGGASGYDSSARYRPYPNQGRHSISSSDPRGIREYVDLDAPMDHVPEIDYRSALKEYQNKNKSL